MRSALSLSLVFTLSLAACATDLSGSGAPTDATIDVTGFHAITVDDRLPVTIAVGAAGPVRIHGDDNLVPLIVARVEGGRLHVGVAGGRGLDPREPLRIVVSTPALDDVVASGGSSVSAGGLVGASVRLEANGAATLVASGAADDVTLLASGGSSLDARALESGAAHVAWSGRASGSARARTRVDGSADGAATLDVYGAPATRSVSSSGGAVVTYR